MNQAQPKISLPSSCSIAFKEWSGVCQALTEGRQSLILRKGGILEGASGFSPEHSAFWLYPTYSHQQTQGLRVPAESTIAPASANLDGLAQVVETIRMETLEPLLALESFHIWKQETIRDRFAYRKPGLWLLVVRIYRRAEPWSIPVEPHYEGCKTWVPLAQDLATESCSPVLDDAKFANVHTELLETLRGKSS